MIVLQKFLSQLKLSKYTYNKGIKLKNYALGNKIYSHF